jgi:hypothetical protein
MVATLFEGDLRYALAVFGKPKGVEAVITPENFALPATLRSIVEVDFILQPSVELFRVYRVVAGAQGLTFFSLQTYARSRDSSRPGPYIGAGVFASAGVDVVALVQALRDLLRSAQAALTKDHTFTVETIGVNEMRLLSVPDSVDRIRAPDVKLTPVMASLPAKHSFVIPSSFHRHTHSVKTFFSVRARRWRQVVGRGRATLMSPRRRRLPTVSAPCTRTFASPWIGMQRCFKRKPINFHNRRQPYNKRYRSQNKHTQMTAPNGKQSDASCCATSSD